MSGTTTRAIAFALAVLLLASCQTTGGGSASRPPTVEAVLGAAGGGPGDNAARGEVSGLVGGAAGNYLDATDRQLAAQAGHRSLEHGRIGDRSKWRNADTGHYGSITATRIYQDANGRYCREYQQTITAGGEPHHSFGTACRRPDGRWRVRS